MTAVLTKSARFGRFPFGPEHEYRERTPTITADPASQAQGMAAQLRTLAGIVEAPTICADEIKPRVTDAKCVRIPANGSPMVVRVAFLPPIHGGDLDCADPPLAPDPLLLHDPGIW